MQTATRDAIDTLVRAAGVPGCAIATTRASGQATVSTHGQAALDPPRPVAPTTVFHLFSGTKLYTAAAVMLLVERGKIGLDEPITAYLPDLLLRHPVTVRQLACHDSGVPDTLRALLSVHAAETPVQRRPRHSRTTASTGGALPAPARATETSTSPSWASP
jgi:CubicO group peptidase (beta-lactamase class C family)